MPTGLLALAIVMSLASPEAGRHVGSPRCPEKVLFIGPRSSKRKKTDTAGHGTVLCCIPVVCRGHNAVAAETALAVVVTSL